MVKINIIAVGKLKEKYLKDGIQEFSKRLSRYSKINVIELSEEDDNKGIEQAIQKESSRIIEVISKKEQAYNVLLDIGGQMLTSAQMASKIESLLLSYSEINFIIGGSNGVSSILREKCDFLLSFSKMTFPHQLMRLILFEQVYRWISINENIKYHK